MAKNNIAKRNESSVEKVEGTDANFLARYLEQDTSLGDLKGYRIVPRLKIIQDPADQKLKATFGVGSVIVRPGDVLVCHCPGEDVLDGNFFFVPIFFGPEFCKWADLKKAGQEPAIHERTIDPTSEIAKKSRDAQARKELYPGHDKLEERQKCYYRYVEHLRFIGMVYGEHPLAGTPVAMSFERGEFGQGRNFISAVSLRRQLIGEKQCPIPLWSQVWKFTTQYHNPDPSRKWYGFKYEPAGIIKPDEAETFNSLYTEFKDLWMKQKLVVDDEAGDEAVDAGATPAGKGEF